MMFVRITDGVNEIEVSQGAFENIYSKQGFTEVKHEPEKKAELVEKTDEEIVAEIEEKPLSKWDKADVKKYADVYGIDISGTKNIEEARDIIREFRDEAE